jgi:hypothetical protein
MEAVQRVRETVEVGRGQMYEKKRGTWSSSPGSHDGGVPYVARVAQCGYVLGRNAASRSRPFAALRPAGGESTSGCPYLPPSGASWPSAANNRLNASCSA